MIDRLRQLWRQARTRASAHVLPNWRQAWRWWSVRVSAIGATIAAIALVLPDVVSAAWGAVPPALIDRLPANAAAIVPLVVELAAIAARILQQRSLRHDD